MLPEGTLDDFEQLENAMKWCWDPFLKSGDFYWVVAIIPGPLPVVAPVESADPLNSWGSMHGHSATIFGSHPSALFVGSWWNVRNWHQEYLWNDVLSLVESSEIPENKFQPSHTATICNYLSRNDTINLPRHWKVTTNGQDSWLAENFWLIISRILAFWLAETILLFLKRFSHWMQPSQCQNGKAISLYPGYPTATTASMPAAPVHVDHPPWDPVKLSSTKAIPDIMKVIGCWILNFWGVPKFGHTNYIGKNSKKTNTSCHFFKSLVYHISLHLSTPKTFLHSVLKNRNVALLPF